MTTPKDRRAELAAHIKSLEESIREHEVAGLDLDKFLEEEPAAPEAQPDPVPLEELERLFLESGRLGRLFKRHPEIAGAYLLRHEDRDVAVTFNRDLFDEHPSTLRLLTYGEPLLRELLSRAPDPLESSSDAGRVVRCEVDGSDLVAYYTGDGEGVAGVETLQRLRLALRASAVGFEPQRLAEVTEQLHLRSAQSHARARSVREQLAMGDLLARQEEARILLRQATYIDTALRSQETESLFDEKSSRGATRILSPSSIHDFARVQNYPYAPLLRLLGPDEIPASNTDPYFLQALGASEKSLRGKSQALQKKAEDLLLRLKTAQERLRNLQQAEDKTTIRTKILQ